MILPEFGIDEPEADSEVLLAVVEGDTIVKGQEKRFLKDISKRTEMRNYRKSLNTENSARTQESSRASQISG